MNIDIDTLTEPELISTSIIASSRACAWAHVGMLEFHIGDRVTTSSARRRADALQSKDRHGARWNVSPVCLRNVEEPTMHHADGANVLILGKR